MNLVYGICSSSNAYKKMLMVKLFSLVNLAFSLCVCFLLYRVNLALALCVSYCIIEANKTMSHLSISTFTCDFILFGAWFSLVTTYFLFFVSYYNIFRIF